MPLTLRHNGTGIQSLVTEDWFNDFYKLFTGQMTDQPITFKPNVTLRSIAAAPGAPTATATSGTGMGVGAYKYAVSFVAADGGETLAGTQASVTTTSGNTIVSLSSIPVDATGAATARNIYRTKVGGSTLFLLHTLADNTTTTYSDSTPDASLSSTQSPSHSTFGGSLIFKDASGNTTLTIANDGSLIGSGGNTSLGSTIITGTFSVSGTSSLDNGNIITDGAGNIQFHGNLGVGGAGNVIDARGFDTWVKARGGNNLIHFQDGGGTDFATIGSSGLSLQTNHTSTPSAIISGTAGIGFKMSNGTKLMEINGSGDLKLSGTWSSGVAQSGFDSFDHAEVHTSDADYPYGTVVCLVDPAQPIPEDLNSFAATVTKCTHDGCALALVVSKEPGITQGHVNAPSRPKYDDSLPISLPLALSGRILVKTAYDIKPGSYVCSDGRGGVRQVVPGDKVTALGVTISSSTSGYVAILIRHTFISL